MSNSSSSSDTDSSLSSFPDEKFLENVLPPTFEYGYATAAWQIEGGRDEDGRGSCVWDDLAKLPGKIVGGADGEIAVDSYHLWREDIRLLKELGSTAYRFSISWSRVIPLGGRNDPINEPGLTYYSNLIDSLLSANIKPYITLFHWDLPSALEKRYGGWSDVEEVSKDFLRFAGLVFERFAGRVKNWITFNEPFIVLRNSSLGLKPDFNWTTDIYTHPRAMILSHAKAVDLFRHVYQPTNGGMIGIVLNCDWFEPLGSDPQAPIAVQARLDAYLGTFADAIYLGKFPDSRVLSGGDRLPDFTKEEWALIKGSSDFFGLNSYSTHYLTGEKLTDRTAEMYGGYVSTQLDLEGNLIGKRGQPSHLKIVPWGFRKIIQYIHNRYLLPLSLPLIITENGYSILNESTLSLPHVLEDTERIEYYRGYIGELVNAVREDGIDVRGYFAWSLLDNLEWMQGFLPLYGSVYVDRKNGCKRYIKKSGMYLKEYFGNAIQGQVI